MLVHWVMIDKILTCGTGYGWDRAKYESATDTDSRQFFMHIFCYWRTILSLLPEENMLPLLWFKKK